MLLMATTSHKLQFTCSLESQLLADHRCIITVPAIITDRAPDSTVTDLHCSLSIALTTNQTNSTICTAGINDCEQFTQDECFINSQIYATNNTVLVLQLGSMYGFL